MRGLRQIIMYVRQSHPTATTEEWKRLVEEEVNLQKLIDKKFAECEATGQSIITPEEWSGK